VSTPHQTRPLPTRACLPRDPICALQPCCLSHTHSRHRASVTPPPVARRRSASAAAGVSAVSTATATIAVPGESLPLRRRRRRGPHRGVHTPRAQQVHRLDTGAPSRDGWLREESAPSRAAPRRAVARRAAPRCVCTCTYVLCMCAVCRASTIAAPGQVDPAPRRAEPCPVYADSRVTVGCTRCMISTRCACCVIVHVPPLRRVAIGIRIGLARAVSRVE
jgi:hypothetical protein